MLYSPTSTWLDLISNIPFDSEYKRVVDFASKTEQQNYFNPKVVITERSFNFVHKDGYFNISTPIEELRNVNYLAYFYVNKVIYCFITKKEYVGKNCTRIFIKTDVFQTYMFDYKLGNMFVDRCHVPRWNGDRPTYEIVDENIQIGEHKASGRQTISTYRDSYIIVSSVPLGKVEKGGITPPPTDPNLPNRLNVVNSARKLLGKPYVWGGNYPPLGSSSGTDCSGLMQWAYNDNGITITRTTYTQINDGVEIPNNSLSLQLGDLIFSNFVNGKPEHVFMFSGNVGNTLYCIEAQTEGVPIKERVFVLTSDMKIRRVLS